MYQPTEIPIQRKLSEVPQPVQPTTPVILPPPEKSSSNDNSNVKNISSIDSSSLGQTSSIQSSTSADSIHVIAIQVKSKVTSRPEKVHFTEFFSPILLLKLYSFFLFRLNKF